MRPERLTFLVPPHPLLTADWIPKGIIKGSFLQEVPHITLPPLNHICSAISSSSTCSNFALEKKKSLSVEIFFFILQLSVVTFPSTETSHSTSFLYWWESITDLHTCGCMFFTVPALQMCLILNHFTDYLLENHCLSYHISFNGHTKGNKTPDLWDLRYLYKIFRFSSWNTKAMIISTGLFRMFMMIFSSFHCKLHVV